MRRHLLVLVSLFMVVSMSVRAQYAHPDLKAGKRKISSFVLMPLHVEISKASMKGGEPMIEESVRAQDALTPVVARVLETSGYKVDQKSLLPPVLAQNPDLRYVVDNTQKKFDEVLKQARRKSGDVRKGRFTLGDEVVNLPQGEHADALLFVRITGQVLTGNKKTFDFFFGTGGMSDAFRIYLGVVDSKTGDLLYFAKPATSMNIVASPNALDVPLEAAFRQFVKFSPPVNPAKN